MYDTHGVGKCQRKRGGVPVLRHLILLQRQEKNHQPLLASMVGKHQTLEHHVPAMLSEPSFSVLMVWRGLE